MPAANPDTIIELGVDYITATFVGRHTESSLPAFGKWLVQQEQAKGEKWRSFGFSGYRGEAAGAAQWGVRHDGCFVRLSSGLAREHWNQVYSMATNVTRLDVQVTVLPEGGPIKRLALHHRQLRRRKRERGRPPKFKAWYGPDGPEAMVLGRRSSDWFGRIYDKGRESGLPEYAGSLRYEAETKNAVALSLANKLDESEEPDTLIARLVHEFMFIRACRTLSWIQERPGMPAVSCIKAIRGRGISDSEENGTFAASVPFEHLGRGKMRKRAIWLSKSVRPSVQALLAMGQQEVVLEALGLTIDTGALVSTDERLWKDFKQWR